MEVKGGLTLIQVEDDTKLTWKWHVTLSGNLKLFGPLVNIIGKKQERRIWTGLKEKLENKK